MLILQRIDYCFWRRVGIHLRILDLILSSTEGNLQNSHSHDACHKKYLF